MSKRCHKPEFLKHGFTCIHSEGNEKPQCDLCFQVLSNESLKENKPKRHFHSCHRNLKEKDLDFFNNRKMRQKPKGSTQVKMNPFSVKRKPLLHLSYLIGKSKAAYSISETLIKPAALAMAKTVCSEEASKN